MVTATGRVADNIKGFAVACTILYLTSIGYGRLPASVAPDMLQDDPLFRAGKPAYTKVTGTVKDEKGRPLADVDLMLQALDDRDQPSYTKSAADGSFAFPAFRDHPDRYFSMQLLAGKKGYTAAIGHVSPLDEPRVDLVLKTGGSLSGSVRDRNGKPVKGATVIYQTLEGGPGSGPHSWMSPTAALVLKSSLEPYFVSRTDGNGQFRFAALPLDKQLGFLVKAEGMRDLNTINDRSEIEYSAQPGSPAPWLILVPEGRVSGRVISEIPGLKVEGLEIHLSEVRGSHWNDVYPVRCDADGRFVFRGLPEGNAYLEVGVQSEAWVPSSAPLVAVQEGKEASFEIKLIEGVVVEGTVVASGDGTPVAGVGVVIHAASRPKATIVRHYVESDKNGSYRLRLPPGEAQFYTERAPKQFVRQSEKDFKQIVIPDGVKKFAGPTLILERQ